MSETYDVNQCGLLPCCLASLDEDMKDRQERGQPLTCEGEVIQCHSCSNSIICENDCWRWNRDEALAKGA